MIRLMRFNANAASGSTSLVDPSKILQDVELEKQKKLERAAKFGTTVVENTLGDKSKKAERMQRFRGGEAGGSSAELTEDQKAKIIERKARFGNVNVAEKIKADIKSGNLEFTLDEYKSKQAKVFGKKKKPIKGGKTLRAKGNAGAGDQNRKKNGFKNKMNKARNVGGAAKGNLMKRKQHFNKRR